MANTTTRSKQPTDGKTASTTLKLPTYDCKLIIKVVDTVSGEAVKLYKKFKIKEDFGGEAEGAMISPNLGIYYLLVGKNYLTHNTLAHEIFHAAVRVTEDRGVTDEEAQAWLAGHITATIYKFLDKKKLTIKHG